MKVDSYNLTFNKESGFTLIEVLVAITLLGFMMIGIYTVTDNSINTKEVVVKEDREFLQLYTMTHRLNQDFSQIYSPFYFSWSEVKTKKGNQNNGGSLDYSQNPAENNRFVPSRFFPKVTVKNHPVPIIETPEKAYLLFMTASNRRFLEGQKQSPYAWVEYSLQTDEEPISAEANQMLVRRALKQGIFLGDFDIKDAKAHTLLRGVKELKFEFWNRRDQDWVDTIRSLPEEERFTLRALRMTLTFVDSSGIERTTLRVFRPAWPYFDSLKDETERAAAANNPVTPNGSNPNGANSNGVNSNEGSDQ